jgi:hypothetical protein
MLQFDEIIITPATVKRPNMYDFKGYKLQLKPIQYKDEIAKAFVSRSSLSICDKENEYELNCIMILEKDTDCINIYVDFID